MSEKAPRTRQDIQNEYTQLCAKAGNLQYQIYAHTKDLEVINTQQRELNFEAAKLAAAEAAEKEAALKSAEAEIKAKEEAPALKAVPNA